MLDEQSFTELAQLPSVEIGAYTVTHPYLDELPRARIASEIQSSRSWIENLLNRRIDTFAYPHGTRPAGTGRGGSAGLLLCGRRSERIARRMRRSLLDMRAS